MKLQWSIFGIKRKFYMERSKRTIANTLAHFRMNRNESKLTFNFGFKRSKIYEKYIF